MPTGTMISNYKRQAIKSNYKRGIHPKTIAKKYSVGLRTIYTICRNLLISKKCKRQKCGKIFQTKSSKREYCCNNCRHAIWMNNQQLTLKYKGYFECIICHKKGILYEEFLNGIHRRYFYYHRKYSKVKYRRLRNEGKTPEEASDNSYVHAKSCCVKKALYPQLPIPQYSH